MNHKNLRKGESSLMTSVSPSHKQELTDASKAREKGLPQTCERQREAVELHTSSVYLHRGIVTHICTPQ